MLCLFVFLFLRANFDKFNILSNIVGEGLNPSLECYSTKQTSIRNVSINSSTVDRG